MNHLLTRLLVSLILAIGSLTAVAGPKALMQTNQGDITLELYTYQDRPEEAGRASLDFLRPIFEETGLAIE